MVSELFLPPSHDGSFLERLRADEATAVDRLEMEEGQGLVPCPAQLREALVPSRQHGGSEQADRGAREDEEEPSDEALWTERQPAPGAFCYFRWF